MTKRRLGFSLVEVTLALGIAAFCLLAAFALLPIGAQTHRAAIGDTEAVGILSAIVSDMRATSKSATTSAQFSIAFGTSKDVYFDEARRPTPSSAGAKYRATISFPANSTTTATLAAIQITWPAVADPAIASTSRLATVTAYDRQ